MEEWIAPIAGLPILLQVLLVAATCVVSEDPVVVACGVLVAAEKMHVGTALAGLIVGILCGDLLLYAAGRALRLGVGRARAVDPARLTRAAAWVERHGTWVILVARCVPGTRLPTYAAVGALGVPLGRFLRLAVPATVAWALLVLWAIGLLEDAVACAERPPAWLLLPALAPLAVSVLFASRRRQSSRSCPADRNALRSAPMPLQSPGRAAESAAT